MIKQQTHYFAICDKCEREFGDSEINWCFTKKKELKEMLEEDAWEVRGNKVFCDECKDKLAVE